MKTDIEIAREAKMLPITEVAKNIGIDYIELYGKYKAKISEETLSSIEHNQDGKLILVTAMNPTPMGEGKTTVTIGLGDAIKRLNKRVIITLREPSLGPCFGIKGGAQGGGLAQVVPMEDLNLHFTGDFHAITSANNLLSALLDNHIKQGNELRIDTNRIIWKRCLDMNDRVLRNVVVGLGGAADGVTREDHFVITAASEIMAILCLATDIRDLKKRLGRIVAAYDIDGKPVTASDLKAVGAMAVLLKEAIKPNLIQTIENTPCIVHGGPFANIAHGCNSIRATKAGLKLADYVITEAGFGADLGAEKFFDIKCPAAGLKPNAVVLVATIRAIKYNAGVNKNSLSDENVDAVKKGLVNIEKHIENLKNYGVPVIVALNKFSSDTEGEINVLKEFCKEKNCEFELAESWEKGGIGSENLAKKVIEMANKPSEFTPLYKYNISIKEKIEKICIEIYGATGVNYEMKANKIIKELDEGAGKNLPVCMVKTQYSLSDDAKLLGRPEGFKVNIKDVYISAGAGFIVVLAGGIMTMPGLPKSPAAFNIDIDDNGIIKGLF